MNGLYPGIIILWLIWPTVAVAQVKIVPSRPHYNVQEAIRATVQNKSSHAITFCVEFGQTSSTGNQIESTPSPFWVQQNLENKWSTLLIGPDVGSVRHPVVVEPGKSEEFALRLNNTGTMRLRLRYWDKSSPLADCAKLQAGTKLATSSVFKID
jgi:hypothetical protein